MVPSLALQCLLLCLGYLSCVDSGLFNKQFSKDPLKWNPLRKADPGSPLFLTPYIEKGEISEARQLSEVKGIGKYPSYSGFFTVNATTKSNMFFWFFPAKNGNKSAPLLLWLQGGPGGSSLFGLFCENGPLMVDKEGNLSERNVTWNAEYQMLYIDNPVGTGFSFTETDSGYATNEVEVGNNLYNAMLQFLTVYTEYQKVDFYITGESYAGKYVPALGYHIHNANPSAKLKINLKGLLIGDGLVDPVNMLGGYDDLMFQMGVLDENEKAFFESQTDIAISDINAGNFIDAFKIFDMLLNGDLIPYPSFFKNVTGCSDYYNILRCEEPEFFDYYGSYVEKDETRKAIHVGNLTYNNGVAVEKHLLNDVMQSTALWLATLMDNYKVLLYNGQLDIIVGAPLTEAFLQKLKWSGQAQYLSVKKTIWKINPSDTDVAGYARTVNNFVQLVVRGGGHILPYDQPERVFDMVMRFISGRGF